MPLRTLVCTSVKVVRTSACVHRSSGKPLGCVPQQVIIWSWPGACILGPVCALKRELCAKRARDGKCLLPVQRPQDVGMLNTVVELWRYPSAQACIRWVQVDSCRSMILNSKYDGDGVHGRNHAWSLARLRILQHVPAS